MFTVGIDVKKTEKELIIKWQLAKFNIVLEDIIEFTGDDPKQNKLIIDSFHVHIMTISNHRCGH
ncbi:hypothetical protein MOF32_19250 [Priestia megaterium]|uniref:SunI/YnzG family protein n=1 Tax=Priestia megaterium TaxID=1404 RepID=UPI00227F05A7|nr:hypothetical protein [Priestia megaterium]MCY9025052.1 hypothetical protein [Priestia megaterium]